MISTKKQSELHPEPLQTKTKKYEKRSSLYLKSCQEPTRKAGLNPMTTSGDVRKRQLEQSSSLSSQQKCILVAEQGIEHTWPGENKPWSKATYQKNPALLSLLNLQWTQHAVKFTESKGFTERPNREDFLTAARPRGFSHAQLCVFQTSRLLQAWCPCHLHAGCPNRSHKVNRLLF